MTADIRAFSKRFKGGCGAIVSLGPSVVRLSEEHFSGVDVVITINEAVRMVRPLGLAVPVFSMQKDASATKHDAEFKPTCVSCSGACPDKVRPVPPEILLVHIHESHHCFEDYPNRVEFDNNSFGLHWSFPSIISAINIMYLFGVESLKMISFDGVISNECGQVINGREADREADGAEALRRVTEYANIRQQVFLFSPMPKMKTEWITPC